MTDWTTDAAPGGFGSTYETARAEFAALLTRSTPEQNPDAARLVPFALMGGALAARVVAQAGREARGIGSQPRSIPRELLQMFVQMSYDAGIMIDCTECGDGEDGHLTMRPEIHGACWALSLALIKTALPRIKEKGGPEAATRVREAMFAMEAEIRNLLQEEHQS